MTIGEWVSFGFSLFGVIALVFGAFWRFNSVIGGKISHLHARIDDVKDKYVRRDDLTGHIERFESGQRDLTKKVDELIMTLVGEKQRR
jgi:hypothetical protein